MNHRIQTFAVGLFIGLLALSSGTLRAADTPAQLPSINDLLNRVSDLQEGIAILEDSGHLNHGRATSLSKKLDNVANALADLSNTQPSGDVSAQQASSPLKGLQKAIDALLDFIKELTHLATELPADVLQPIVDSAIGLLEDILGLLLA